MNTMLKRKQSNNSTNNIFVQFNDFAENFRRSGRDPQAVLDELVNSGKVSKEDVEKATNLANQFSWLIKK